MSFLLAFLLTFLPAFLSERTGTETVIYYVVFSLISGGVIGARGYLPFVVYNVWWLLPVSLVGGLAGGFLGYRLRTGEWPDLKDKTECKT